MKPIAVALLVLAPLVLFVVVWRAYLKWVGEGQSRVIRYGGALLAGVFVTTGVFSLIMKVVTLVEPVPASLTEAQIPQQAGWSADQANQAARITRAALERAYERIDKADETGDAPLVLETYDEMLPLITGWNMQGDSPAAAPHRACSLAIAHLMDGAAHVTNGQRWVIRDRYKNTVSDCG